MMYTKRTWRQRDEWRPINRSTQGSRKFPGHESIPRINILKAYPCGPLLQSIHLGDLVGDVSEIKRGSKSAEIKNCRTVASYNWVQKETPSILVPGMAPRWTPLSEPRTLNPDRGTYFRDENAARFPDHPIEPMVEAILSTDQSQPNSNAAGGLDIVACGSTLGNLLRFALGEEMQFRMLVEVVGSTVHLIRRESSPTETIKGVRGYGHTFPEAYTSWDSSVRGSESHQRVVRYEFGGLQCLVRFEGDGYLPEKAGFTHSQSETPGPNDQDDLESSTLEDLALLLEGNKVSSAQASAKPSGLSIATAGISLSQEAIFDLKTRAKNRKLQEEEIIEGQLPRLWIRQIPNLILAYHDRGRFEDIQIHDLREVTKKWQLEKIKEVKRFAAILQKIVEIARRDGEGRLEVTRREGDDAIQIRQQASDVPLPLSSQALDRWKHWLSGQEVESCPSLSHKRLPSSDV